MTMSKLTNYWYIVARERDVRRKPRSIRLFNQHYVVFQAQNGEFAALQDRCPHRNVPLSEGKVCDGEIQCPYHGWRFNSKGELSHIPSLPTQTPPNIIVPSVHCCAQDGYIWLCVGEPESPKPLPFAHLGETGWVSFKMRKRFQASVAQCLENFLDCPHAVYVHQGLFRSPTRKPVRATLRYLSDGAQVEYANEPREQSLVWQWLQNSDTEMRHTDRFIAPATSRVDYQFSDKKHYIITSSCTPLSDTETEVHTVMTFKYGQWGNFIRLFFEPLSHIIIQQDVNILKKQRDNINRFGGTERFYIHSEMDVLLPAIVAWRKALSEGTTPPPADMVKEFELFL